MSILKPCLLTNIKQFWHWTEIHCTCNGFIHYADCTVGHRLEIVPDSQHFQIAFGDYFSDSIEWYEQANLSFDNILKAPCEGLSIIKNSIVQLASTATHLAKLYDATEWKNSSRSRVMRIGPYFYSKILFEALACHIWLVFYNDEQHIIYV